MKHALLSIIYSDKEDEEELEEVDHITEEDGRRVWNISILK
jgi:predicted nuclease of restriction endonuclease-like RecB superfamily